MTSLPPRGHHHRPDHPGHFVDERGHITLGLWPTNILLIGRKS